MRSTALASKTCPHRSSKAAAIENSAAFRSSVEEVASFRAAARALSACFLSVADVVNRNLRYLFRAGRRCHKTNIRKHAGPLSAQSNTHREFGQGGVSVWPQPFRNQGDVLSYPSAFPPFLAENYLQRPKHCERVDVFDAKLVANLRNLDIVSGLWRWQFMGNNHAATGLGEGYQPAVRS